MLCWRTKAGLRPILPSRRSELRIPDNFRSQPRLIRPDDVSYVWDVLVAGIVQIRQGDLNAVAIGGPGEAVGAASP